MYRLQISTSSFVGCATARARKEHPGPRGGWGHVREHFAQDGAGASRNAVVDDRAVHQEEGLGNGAHDVFIGDRGIDAEEAVEEQPGASLAHGARPAFLPACEASPAASAALAGRLSWSEGLSAGSDPVAGSRRPWPGPGGLGLFLFAG